MSSIIRTALAVTVASLAMLTVASGSAVAAGPQQLPDSACNAATAAASANAPNRTSAEAIPHIVHSVPFDVPYCHHFNPTAPTPTGM
jgi:hypothetical protein